MITLEQFMDNLLDNLNEENAAGHSPKRVAKWLKVNGYKQIDHNSHPKYLHTDTNHTVIGVNSHAKDQISGIRGMIKAIKTNHEKHNITYHPLDSKIDSM